MGGQSIPAFDYGLAPAVARSFIKNLAYIMEVLGYHDDDTDKLKATLRKWAFPSGKYDDFRSLLSDEGLAVVHSCLMEIFYLQEDEQAEDYIAKALLKTNKDTYQAMEGLIHNLNTMHSRAGAQVPFSSINYGTDTSAEGRMVIENVLLAEDAGLGNGETPIFPIHIFKMRKGFTSEEGDPNHDLFKLACRVSAKRLFPNFSYMDSPFNAESLTEDGDPNYEVAYMGCTEPTEIITYSVNDYLCVEGIERAFDKLAQFHEVKKFGVSSYIDVEGKNVFIYDSSVHGFVGVKKFIRNPNRDNWKLVKLSNGRNIVVTDDHPLPVIGKGRTLVKDLCLNDEIPCVSDQFSQETIKQEPELAWLLGLILCDGSYDTSICVSIGLDEHDIYERIDKVCKRYGWQAVLVEQNRGEKGHYYDVRINTGTFKAMKKQFVDLFGGLRKTERHIPNVVFSWNKDAKAAFFAGMIDADGYAREDRSIISIGSTNKELALQQMALAQALGFKAKTYRNHYKRDCEKVRHTVDIAGYVPCFEKVAVWMSSGKKVRRIMDFKGLGEDYEDMSVCRVMSIDDYHIEEFSYDVETDTDRFDFSGINSHNCRTRVMANRCGEGTTFGRGNLSFTSINLPRLGIRHKGDVPGFFKALDDMLELVFDQLYERLQVQGARKVRNFPFLMGQGVWRGSENLGPDDEIADILKHGTLTVGFIGLAECLKALVGSHHGESDEARDLGLKIVQHMREACDRRGEKSGLNYTLIATPAEGLSGRFVRIDRSIFGNIPEVTDRDYYTNSFHVPVYYHISAYRKIRIEAPYHAMTNGGHISYVELDGDPLNNLQAFEDLVKFMGKEGMGYASLNHPIDRCPICGFTGIIGNECPRCGVTEGQVLSKAQINEIQKRYR